MLLPKDLWWGTMVTRQQDGLLEMLAISGESLVHNLFPSARSLAPGPSYLFVFTQLCWLPWGPNAVTELLFHAGNANNLGTKSSSTLVKYLCLPSRIRSWWAGLEDTSMGFRNGMLIFPLHLCCPRRSQHIPLHLVHHLQNNDVIICFICLIYGIDIRSRACADSGPSKKAAVTFVNDAGGFSTNVCWSLV